MNNMEKEREGIKSGDNGTRGSEKITREKPDGGAAQSSEKAPGGRRKQKGIRTDTHNRRRGCAVRAGKRCAAISSARQISSAA